MTGIKDKFIFLHLSNQFLSVHIVDGTQSLLFGDGAVQTTLFFNLTNMLYIPKFPIICYR